MDEQAQLISDNIYEKMNQGGNTAFGATLCGVWLIGGHAVFVNLGDSRGYLLGFYKKHVRQVTNDHNVAANMALYKVTQVSELIKRTEDHSLLRAIAEHEDIDDRLRAINRLCAIDCFYDEDFKQKVFGDIAVNAKSSSTRQYAEQLLVELIASEKLSESTLAGIAKTNDYSKTRYCALRGVKNSETLADNRCGDTVRRIARGKHIESVKGLEAKQDLERSVRTEGKIEEDEPHEDK